MIIKCHLGITPSKDCYEVCMQSRRCEALKMWENRADKMTNKQAIRICKALWAYKNPDYTEAEIREALDMAIEALQQDCEKIVKSCDDYITIKRQFVLDAIDIGLSGCITNDDKLTLEGMGIAVSDLPSVQSEAGIQMSSTDCISRQAVIEFIQSLYPSAPIVRWGRELWKEKYKQYIEVEKALEMLPSAQPEQNGWVHIDDIYRLISGHSNYHGDNILAALTCLAEGKDVPNPIDVLKSPEPYKGE